MVKKRNRHLGCISSLIILSFILFVEIVYTSDNVRNIKVGEVIPNVEIKDKPAFYKLSVKNAYKEGKDLIIKVIPEDYESDPDIYISKVNSYKNFLIFLID